MTPRARRALILRSSFAALVVLVIAFPFLWIVLNSFRDPENFLSLDLADALPHTIDLTSYQMALRRADLLRWLATSLAVASATTVISLAVSAPMAFALARLRFRGRGVASAVLVLHYAVPSITIAVPLFVLLIALGQYDSLPALVLVHSSLTIPFCTWVLRDFYATIPAEVEEAGYVDGGGLRQVLLRIVLPLSVPALLAAGAYAFILSWNDFLFAFILIFSQDNFTAPVGIHAFFTGRNIEQSLWAQLMAASTLVSLPSAILFGVFQRYLVSGFLTGAVRG
jgi:ABC-type glycerol-3-phosphate transport system permease component